MSYGEMVAGCNRAPCCCPGDPSGGLPLAAPPEEDGDEEAVCCVAEWPFPAVVDDGLDPSGGEEADGDLEVVEEEAPPLDVFLALEACCCCCSCCCCCLAAAALCCEAKQWHCENPLKKQTEHWTSSSAAFLSKVGLCCRIITRASPSPDYDWADDKTADPVPGG